MPQSTACCIPLSSETIKTSATEAWREVQPIAEILPKPKAESLARFFPTDACEPPINAAILELKDQARISSFRTGGFVFFPGISHVGRSRTIFIPLFIEGEISIDGLTLDISHHYHISRKCQVKVAEAARLVALVIDLD